MAHTAVVTGGTGYLATELIKQLMDRGYNVRATVRSLASTATLENLAKALPG